MKIQRVAPRHGRPHRPERGLVDIDFVELGPRRVFEVSPTTPISGVPSTAVGMSA